MKRPPSPRCLLS